MQTIHSILKQYWHYDAFRPMQENIINHVLAGNDTLGILPTGGGKSICYQVPAMAMKGTCIVISPLIALMKDQALGLSKRGIPTLVVFSGMSKKEVEINYQKVATGQYKFLFVSPERLRSSLFLDYLSDWDINLIAVDEAHCISQWGYDFRPPYLQIAEFREYLPDIPILALTASATPFVQKDIIEKLHFKQYQTYFTSFARENISLSAFKVENKIVKAIEILQKIQGTGIVYCRNRKRTKEIAETLAAQGFSADYYHAGLDQEIRNKKQDDWIQNRTNIIVCTNAFGMGIDKPDVRIVIHYDLPDTPEAYYQEAGRAGRDGLKSYAVLLYQPKDLVDLQNGIALRYPSNVIIRKTYNALCQYLQVGIGSGTDEIFDFEITDFCKKFELNLIETMSSIKLLEMLAYWQLSESIFLPSRVSVIANKSLIIELEKNHPKLDEVLKHLLRIYGGILNHFVPISEFQIAQKAQVAKDYIEMILDQLESHHIIEYKKAKDKPQLFFQHDRVSDNELYIDRNMIDILKNRYEDRVQFMISYTETATECRAKKLIGYFGENVSSDCGQCDNCLQLKKNRKPTDYETIKNTILHEITLNGSLNIGLFCKKYPTSRQDELLKLIRFMVDEHLLELNMNGDLIDKK
jgi:ATP-dependent DNA helicase RecQ